MTTSEILIAARDLIPDVDHWSSCGEDAEPAGWGEGGRYCMVGAIAQVMTGRPMNAFYWEPPAPVFALARALGVPNQYAVTNFNDNAERTLSEVHAVFDRAIANELAREQEHTATAIPETVAA
jgi:hypothetical protein